LTLPFLRTGGTHPTYIPLTGRLQTWDVLPREAVNSHGYTAALPRLPRPILQPPSDPGDMTTGDARLPAGTEHYRLPPPAADRSHTTTPTPTPPHPWRFGPDSPVYTARTFERSGFTPPGTPLRTVDVVQFCRDCVTVWNYLLRLDYGRTLTPPTRLYRWTFTRTATDCCLGRRWMDAWNWRFHHPGTHLPPPVYTGATANWTTGRTTFTGVRAAPRTRRVTELPRGSPPGNDVSLNS